VLEVEVGIRALGSQRRAGIVPHLKDDDAEEQEHEVGDDEEAAG
jgi:hypothetical protein